MLVPIGSNNSGVWRQESMVNFRGMKEIPTEEASPEKAGVGGSIPSLATMFSNSYSGLFPASVPIPHAWLAGVSPLSDGLVAGMLERSKGAKRRGSRLLSATFR